jgi:hypothetical protein
MKSHDLSGSNLRMGELSAKIIPVAGLTGVVGVGVGVAMGWLNIADSKEQFFRSYLMAFMFVTSISLGGLFFVILQHCVKAGWSVAVRRLAEGVASNLMWLWVLFIPIWLGMKWGHLYEWVHPGDDPILLGKAGYLNPTFWTIRAVFYLGLWALLARYFVGSSIKQDSTGDIEITNRMQARAPVAIGLVFVTMAFSSIDWIMSLEPHWFSTMFGVYFFAACSCGFYAALILLMYFVQRSGRMTNEITPEHYQDAGKLLFAFGIVFWAYIAFSQYMLIWYANIPEETPWYLARQMNGWVYLSLTLLIGHFALPFVLLISRHPKRVPHTLAALAAWMLLMHLGDIYWLVMPHVPTDMVRAATGLGQLMSDVTADDVRFHPGLIDLVNVVGMAGLLVAGTAVRLSGCSLLPERDPRLHESLVFENV